MRTLLTGLLLFALSSFSIAQDSGSADKAQERAAQIVTQLSSGDFAAATADFDSTMKAALPGEKMAEAWNGLIGQVGQYKGQKSARLMEHGGFKMVVVTSEFEKADIDIRVAFDETGKVAGLTFAPAQAASPKFESAPYVDSTSFRKTELTIGGDAWPLGATLTAPWGGKPVPAVVLVHGSGPNDRDETIGPNKPFRDLAEGLSSRGIAVLRYDKRTFKHGKKMMEKLDSLTVKEETIDDAILAVRLLKKTPGIDTSKIFLLGHSLGGMMIPRIAAAEPGIAGFIIMAGATKPLEDLILEQMQYIFALDDSISDKEKEQLETVRGQAAYVKSDSLSVSTPRDRLPLGMPAKYWLDLRGYDPAAEAKKITRPVLVIHGENDYQVSMRNYDDWKKSLDGKKNVTMISYPGLNHLFIESQGKSSPEEYNKPGHVSLKVVEDIEKWIEGN